METEKKKRGRPPKHKAMEFEGMTYEQIGELADDSSADADNSSDESYSEKYAKQMSFSETDHSYSE